MHNTTVVVVAAAWLNQWNCCSLHTHHACIPLLFLLIPTSLGRELCFAAFLCCCAGLVMLCPRRRFPSVLPSINPSATGECRMGRRPRGVSGTNLIFLCLTGNFETELANSAIGYSLSGARRRGFSSTSEAFFGWRPSRKHSTCHCILTCCMSHFLSDADD